MPRKTVNKIDSTPAAVSKSAVVPPQRWALSIDFLMKVGEKHVHDLVWDEYIAALAWKIILQIDRMPTKDAEPRFLEHVVDTIQQRMARDTRLANLIGCLFDKAPLSPAAEAFKSSLLMTLSKSLRRSFHKELAKFVKGVTAFAKIWYCAVNAGATATDVVRANASMRAHRPVLLTTAFTAMPSKQAKLHNITGPQDMPACTVALVSSILKK